MAAEPESGLGVAAAVNLEVATKWAPSSGRVVQLKSKFLLDMGSAEGAAAAARARGEGARVADTVNNLDLALGPRAPH